LPSNVINEIEKGRINLDDPAVTVALLKLNAVLGVTGVFGASGTLTSVGIQCSFCHSTVDDSHPPLCFGAIAPNPGTGCIGHRLDAWSNRDLNVGAIVALAPDLTAFATLLGTDHMTVRNVLRSWGPGKFDAELILDGKAFNPVRHRSPSRNAFVATLEMHGVGRLFDPRLNDAAQFPIAASHGFGDLPHISPDDDQITSKLSDLQFYQLAIAAGICTRLLKSASTHFKPTGRRTSATAPLRSGPFSRT